MKTIKCGIVLMICVLPLEGVKINLHFMQDVAGLYGKIFFFTENDIEPPVLVSLLAGAELYPISPRNSHMA